MKLKSRRKGDSVRKEMNSNKNKIKYFCEQFENFPLILSLCYCSHSCCCQSSSSSLRKSFLLPFFSLYAISFHNCSHLHCAACSTSRVNIINYKIIYGKSSSCYLHLCVYVFESEYEKVFIKVYCKDTI